MRAGRFPFAVAVAAFAAAALPLASPAEAQVRGNPSFWVAKNHDRSNIVPRIAQTPRNHDRSNVAPRAAQVPAALVQSLTAGDNSRARQPAAALVRSMSRLEGHGGVAEAVARFNAFVDASSAGFLRNPPAEFVALARALEAEAAIARRTQHSPMEPSLDLDVVGGGGQQRSGGSEPRR